MTNPCKTHSLTVFWSLLQCYLWRKTFLTSLTRVVFLLHSILAPCFTFFRTFLTTQHYMYSFASFRKYLGNTHYVSGTVLSSGDTEKNKIKSLHPLHLCKQALQIQFVSHYIRLLYLFIFFKKRPNPYHQQKAACQVPWLKPTLTIPASI